MGKTSLLRYIASPEAWRVRELDLSRTFIVNVVCPTPFSPTAFWHEVLFEFKAYAEKDPALVAIADDLMRAETLTTRDIRQLLRAIGKREQSLVLLVDEFDAALQPHDTYSEMQMRAFLHELRSFIVHGKDGRFLSLVVATRRRIHELGPQVRSAATSPWYNHFLFLPLRLFDESEVQRLMEKMPDVFGLSDAERSWVRQVADGHPYLLQAALSILFRLHALEQPFELKGATQELVSIVEPFFAPLWDTSSPDERMLLMLIALGNYQERSGRRLKDFDYDAILSQRERKLRDLEERGLLTRSTSQVPNRYALVSSVMEWWIIKEIEARREEELEELEKVFSPLSRNRVEQIREALRQIRQSKIAFGSLEAWGQPAGAVRTTR
jgi:AAA domain-containing protein